MLKCRWLLLCVFISSFNIYAESIIDVENYQGLTSDKRSFRVGEPLVILVVEATVAESSAGTGVSKNIDIKAGAFDNIKSVSAGLGISGSDDGSGQTIRRGRATTQLSATIVEVLTNDMYKISGTQKLLINGEEQTVRLDGVVRARDI